MTNRRCRSDASRRVRTHGGLRLRWCRREDEAGQAWRFNIIAARRATHEGALRWARRHPSLSSPASNARAQCEGRGTRFKRRNKKSEFGVAASDVCPSFPTPGSPSLATLAGDDRGVCRSFCTMMLANFRRRLLAFDPLQIVAHDLRIDAHVVVADTALAADVEARTDPARRLDADGHVRDQPEPEARHRRLDHALL